jgi:hypothetical protein
MWTVYACSMERNMKDSNSARPQRNPWCLGCGAWKNLSLVIKPIASELAPERAEAETEYGHCAIGVFRSLQRDDGNWQTAAVDRKATKSDLATSDIRNR